MEMRRGHGAGSGFLQRNFLWLLVGGYSLAGVAPAAGRWLSDLAGMGGLFGHAIRVPVPAAMLGVLLFAAGFAVKGEHLRGVFRRPSALVLELAASVTVPVLVLLLAAPLVSLWHDPAEARDVLVGLAVVAAMPIAGSSAGWSRAADGDCALSLGLVLLSTLLSPLTTPLAFGTAARLVPGDAGSVLDGFTGVGGAGAFVVVWVVLPTALGLAARWVVGGIWSDAAGPWVKRATVVVLLVLCYANASTCPYRRPVARARATSSAATTRSCAIHHVPARRRRLSRPGSICGPSTPLPMGGALLPERLHNLRGHIPC